MNQQSKAMLYGLLAVLCWSTIATAFKLTLRYITPLQLIMLAAIVSWLFLLGVLIVQRRSHQLFDLRRRDVLRSLGFGLLNPVLYYLLLIYAYAALPAQEAQSINYSWAIVMSLLAAPMLGHTLSTKDIIAAVLCYTGVLIIATRGDVLSLRFENTFGVLLALASTFTWSIYWILCRRDDREPILGLFMNFTFGIPVLAAILYHQQQIQPIPWQGVVGGIYIGLFEMGLAFVLWLFAMKYTDNTARIANLIFIAPLISLLLIANVLGETILPSTIIALGLILFGLAIQQRQAKI